MCNEDLSKSAILAEIEQELRKMSKDNINVIKDVVAEQAAAAEVGGKTNG